MTLIKLPRLLILFISALFVSCSVSKQISKSANEVVLSHKALTNAHVGLSIFEPATNKYWFNHQGDKYFVPASNIKIPTCYAAMKYLGDSLVSFMVGENEENVYFKPSGDPTFLNAEFNFQPAFKLMQSAKKRFYILKDDRTRITELGSGWSWDDYQEYYLAERSFMPVYGNVIHFDRQNDTLLVSPPILHKPYFEESTMTLLGLQSMDKKFRVSRRKDENKFSFSTATTEFKSQEIPFKTSNLEMISFLEDTLHLKETGIRVAPDLRKIKLSIIHSVKVDSLLKPMMHRSDNFFAEQSLIMVSDRLLGYMDDRKIRDSLLNSDFKDLPQKPRWADGSGLSRYNLFTPQDFVAILNKMKNEFGMERLKVILPTGGEGTISSYYKADSNYIFGKTGTLSGVVAFSGFMYTKKGRLLIFSTLVNNHQATSTDVRRAIEKFLQGVRNQY